MDKRSEQEQDVEKVAEEPILGGVSGSVLATQPATAPELVFRAHWHLFVPTFVILFLYVTGWLVLYYIGRSDGALARLFIIVLAVGVPLLFAHAFLRYQTIYVEVFDKFLRYQTGWPRSEPVILPYEMIQHIRATRGLSGRMFGGGTLILKLISGKRVWITDIERSRTACSTISSKL